MRSCLIDGEVVCCDERGLSRFDVLRRRRNEVAAFLYAFDLLELDGTALRREPIEVLRFMSTRLIHGPDGAAGFTTSPISTSPNGVSVLHWWGSA